MYQFFSVAFWSLVLSSSPHIYTYYSLTNLPVETWQTAFRVALKAHLTAYLALILFCLILTASDSSNPVLQHSAGSLSLCIIKAFENWHLGCSSPDVEGLLGWFFACLILQHLNMLVGNLCYFLRAGTCLKYDCWLVSETIKILS